jgi:3-hydroxyanthranilate 3,4-dioxygenase
MLPPINLKQWIEDHKEQLRPPVCNQQVYDMGDFIIMAIGGPNSRKDYHDDPGEEFFYQLKGDMVLRVMENGRPRDIAIKEGEVFLLPSHVYHSPQRFADTVGLVIERKRAEGELDGFLWFCDKCHAQLHHESISVKNIVKDLPPLFKRFWDSESARTCKSCGYVMPLPEKKAA